MNQKNVFSLLFTLFVNLHVMNMLKGIPIVLLYSTENFMSITVRVTTEVECIIAIPST
jgi:hypothetical protein